MDLTAIQDSLTLLNDTTIQDTLVVIHQHTVVSDMSKDEILTVYQDLIQEGERNRQIWFFFLGGLVAVFGIILPILVGVRWRQLIKKRTEKAVLKWVEGIKGQKVIKNQIIQPAIERVQSQINENQEKNEQQTKKLLDFIRNYITEVALRELKREEDVEAILFHSKMILVSSIIGENPENITFIESLIVIVSTQPKFSEHLGGVKDIVKHLNILLDEGYQVNQKTKESVINLRDRLESIIKSKSK
jgi:hypothetical protein